MPSVSITPASSPIDLSSCWTLLSSLSGFGQRDLKFDSDVQKSYMRNFLPFLLKWLPLKAIGLWKCVL